MADGSRRAKLAAAKKKLKEYQQKKVVPSASSGAKKKATNDGSETAETSIENNNEICEMPLQNILKVLVADRSKSNGVKLPSLDRLKASLENDVDSLVRGQRIDDATPAHLHTPNSNLPNTMTIDHTMNLAADENQSEESRGVSSTESLRQLSTQLNGLVTQTTYMNGESAACTFNPNELETRNQELTVALDSSNLTNREQSTKIEELGKHIQELKNQLEKEKQAFDLKSNQKCESMKEQLKLHVDTIEILVSEKSELQSALAHAKQIVRSKADEAGDLNSKLSASSQRVAELEQTLSSISSQQKQSDKIYKELEKERANLKQELDKLNKMSDELKQQNSELSEQLSSKVFENDLVKQNIQDLQKRLEMAELTIQQFSNQSELPDADQQLHLALEEKAQLEAQMNQLSKSQQLLLVERDQYAHKLVEERYVWQQKVQQLAEQVNALSEEKEWNRNRMQELEASLIELQNRSAQQCEVSESQTMPQPEGPTEQEKLLEDSVQTLQREKEELYTQYQAQVHDNEQLSHLNLELEERLQELERTVQRYNDNSVDRKQLLENMQSDKATISRALTQNRELKEQLAELQNAFVKLTNENMELSSALQSEQYVKKELAKKVGNMHENVADLKEKLEVKSQEAQTMQGERNELCAHLQQYIAAYQQLVAEREEFQKHIQQAHFVDRLQHEEVQERVQSELQPNDHMVTKEQLERLNDENKGLKSMISNLSADLSKISSQLGEDDGLQGHLIAKHGNQKTNHVTIPAELETKEEMADLQNSTLNQDLLTPQNLEQEQKQQVLLPQMSALTDEQEQLRGATEVVNDAETVPTNLYDALKTTMNTLQTQLANLLEEKVDLKKKLGQLEHYCTQLSGETDTIGEYIALYQKQRAILKQRHTVKEEYICKLAQDKEKLRKKLGELQELSLELAGERKKWYDRYVHFLKQSKIPLTPEMRQDVLEEDLVPNNEDLEDISLGDDIEFESISPSSRYSSRGPAAKAAVPSEDYTTKKIIELTEEIQNPQTQPSSTLTFINCVPLFYKLAENGVMKIEVV
ncbi:golgin subfamily A member 2 isoform X2 [Carcharodon carcharias]|uniref:golgin subfamily A member 2 isoform X2 n=1 Tax=Carcharodon carcharias TaxID=13397 RepID=UPI001B7E6A2D|nr:golgin subfamily A member 2 isoform X2 [Carcharodon carcharias]